MGSLIQLLVVIIVLGLLYWLVTLLPLPAPFKPIALAVVVLIAIVWLLSFAGLLPRFGANGENRTREILVGNEAPCHLATFASVGQARVELATRSFSDCRSTT